MRRSVIAVAFLVMSAAACVGGKQQASAEDKEKLKAYILDALPADLRLQMTRDSGRKESTAAAAPEEGNEFASVYVSIAIVDLSRCSQRRAHCIRRP